MSYRVFKKTIFKTFLIDWYLLKVFIAQKFEKWAQFEIWNFLRGIYIINDNDFTVNMFFFCNLNKGKLIQIEKIV